MLKKMGVKKYQSHETSELELHPGVNVILGDSMAGKTALLRAMRDLMEGCSGLRRRSWSAKPGEMMEIYAVTSEGVEVSLSKNEKSTTYKVGGEEFVGGVSVPEEVTRVLRLTDLNIQKQLEPYFLVCDNPPEIARQVSAIMRIEKVDEWTSELTSRLNSVNKENALLTEQIKQHNKELTQLPDLDVMGKMVAEAEKLEQELAILSASLSGLEQLHFDLEEATAQMGRYSDMLSAEIHITRSESYARRVEALEEKEQLLLELKAEHEALLKEKGFVDFCEPLVGGCEILAMEIQQLSIRERELSRLRQELEQAGNDACLQMDVVGATEQEFVDFLRQTGRCPFCLSSLTVADIGDLLEHI